MLPAVLSRHTLLVAAIFIPYMLLMAGLFAYICWPLVKRDRERDDQDEAREGDPGEMRLAA